jgi:predicted metalloprotease
MAVGGGLGTVLLVVLYLVMGGDPGALQGPALAPQPQQQPGPRPEAEERLAQFAKVVLADTEDVWHEQFRAQLKREYAVPTLVLFTGQVESACGRASAAVGPFYCPADRQVYLDLSFFTELAERFGAPGDFAQAYVIAHEVGHHVQTVLGIADRIRQEQHGSSEERSNALQVRMELQADCLAGVWAHHAENQRNRLEPGDVEEGLRAAAAIGDDQMQRRATGTVQPESWTHGSSQMRQTWLRRGLETGDVDACDTYHATAL